MRRFRLLVLAVAVVMAAALAVSAVAQRAAADGTLPELRCPEGTLELSVRALDDRALLAGVTAWDEKDGDLTDRIVVQGLGKSIEDGMTTVTYVVADEDHHVATVTRPVRLVDYQPPRFTLSQPLTYPVGASIAVRDRLTAWDAIDGDLSDRIKLTTNGLAVYSEGTYPLTCEVTNSLGDTATVSLELTIRNESSGAPQIVLSTYLVYLQAGEELDPLAYVDQVIGGDRRNIQVRGPEEGLTEGATGRVVYTCRGANGETGTATLYVIVE